MRIRALHLMFLAATLVPSTALGLERKPADVVDPLDTITVRDAREKMEILASPAMEGRRAGTPGARRAAEYIASRFERAGLEPGGSEKRWFQNVRVPRAYMPGKGNCMRILGTKRVFELDYLSDFAPFGFSGNGLVRAEVVFAGYGIRDAKSGWDDYAGLDVRGKIVLVLRRGPRGKLEKHFSEGPGSQSVSLHAKARFAQEAGAAGMILVTDPARLDRPERLAFMAGGGDGIRIPCVHATNRIGNALVGVARKNLSSLQRAIDDSGKSCSLEIRGLEVELGTGIRTGDDSCVNVVGVLRGTDESLGECLVIGAHFDHLGYGDIGAMGGKPGEIFCGADDNASGSVALMEIAEAFASAPFKPRRSVVFVAFTGEEAGLIGSYAYAASPLFPADKTVAMINLDMVGRVRNNKITAMGVGSGDTLEEVFVEANKAVGLDLGLAMASYPGSDHQPFLVKKIPVVFLCSGTHPQYHKPSDTADTINLDGLARTAKLSYLAAAKLASMESRPVFTGQPGGGRRQGRRVRMGVVPDITFEGEGARIASVQPDMPAARAGLRDGDVVVAVDGRKVVDTGSLTAALSSIKPGSKVIVVLVRDGKRIEVEMEFEK